MRGAKKPWVVDATSKIAVAAGFVPMPTEPFSKILPVPLGSMVRASLVSLVVIVGVVLFNPKIKSPKLISPAVPSRMIRAEAVAVVD